MWFLLSDKFNGSKMCDIIGQHEVLKVTFKVIRVSKTTLGAERSTFMTHRAYINNFGNTLHLVYRVMLLSSTRYQRSLKLRSLAPGARARNDERASETPSSGGLFTIAKTQNLFSMIGFDQKAEQQNK